MTAACMWLIAPAIFQAGVMLLMTYWPIAYDGWYGWTIMIPRLIAVLFFSMLAWMISAIGIYWRYVL
jgi:hypothetical protein